MRIDAVGAARRLALSVISALALGALLSAPAIAQSAPAIRAATALGPESATLHGIVDTGNGAEGTPCYSFEYDTRSDWAGRQDLVRYTPIVCLRAGSGDVAVTTRVGCPRSTTCGAGVRLAPATRYQTTLLVQYVGDGDYYYAEQLSSPQTVFTTQALGTVRLRSPTVAVRSGVAAIGLVCASARFCRGRLELTVAQGHRAVRCLSSSLSIRADTHATVDAKLTGECRALVSAAARSGLRGKLSVTATTGQSGILARRVMLVTAG
jgi:hypothetical protein